MDDGKNTPRSDLLPEISAQDQALLERYDRTFIGAYTHSLDNKGRLIIPQVYREGLGKTFYIGPTFNFKSVALYPNLVWARTRDNYARLSSFNAKLKVFLEQFDAMSFRDQELDGQGRVLLPQRIRQRILGDSKEIEVSGAGEYVRLAPSENSDLDFARLMEQMDDIQAAIDSLGGR